MNPEKLMERINAVQAGRYAMTMAEMRIIRAAAEDHPAEICYSAFCYGFLKGQHAARAEAKREHTERIAQDTTGWYGYLSRWLKRNAEHPVLLEKLGVRAQTLQLIAEKSGGGAI